MTEIRIKDPRKLTKGFLIGGGIVLTGILLEWIVGPLKWSALSWPINIIVFSAFMALIVAIGLLQKRVAALRFLGTYAAALPAMAYGVLLTIVMGLTRQEPGGTWWNNMLGCWPFVLIYVYMMLIVGLVGLRRITGLRQHHRMRDVASLMNHLGLFIALTCGTLGNADMQRLKLIADVRLPEWRGLTQNGEVRELPLAIELQQFILETYDDGSPKRFASRIKILTQKGERMEATVDVNKPITAEGWKIYQYGYDTQMGPQSRTSIFELVSDPWLPAVYAGIFMMLAGALMMLLMTVWHRLQRSSKKARMGYSVLIVLAAVFAYFFFSGFNTKTLMPALQSPWFAPHVLVYIFAYSLLGAATFMAIWVIIKPMGKNANEPSPMLSHIDNLVYMGIAFITFGMLFGALWAKEAWGHYWSWDPKETWAAITWLSYLFYIHLRLHRPQSLRPAMVILIVAFLLLQMCWWGINYLPSAQGASVHTYNQ